jgi:hypothetical protein
MVAVAIVGLACGGEVLRRRRVYYSEQAVVCGILAVERRSDDPEVDRHLRQRTAYYYRQRLKYERAARYPWLPVPPDPPKPE